MSIENFEFYKKPSTELPIAISLDDCDLSIRAYQFLKNIGVTNLAELSTCSEQEILEKSNNPKTLKEIKELLQENNLSLKKDQE